MSELDELLEREVASEEMYHGKLLRVMCDTVELPNGKLATREYIKHVGAVCMVAVTEDGNVIMERQYRYPARQVISEIPAGKLDSRQEDRLEAAKRELQEETGYTADNWEVLGEFISTPAYTEEVVTMYLATGLHKGERHLDEEEFLNVYEAPLEEVVRQILSGEIPDGKTQAAVLKAYLLLREQAGDQQ